MLFLPLRPRGAGKHTGLRGTARLAAAACVAAALLPAGCQEKVKPHGQSPRRLSPPPVGRNPEQGPTAESRGPRRRVASITIRVSDVRFPDNHEDHAVRPGESFQIADTEYWAEVGEFVPDFVLSMETREVSSRSREPNNPAVRLSLFRGDEKLYESWVMKSGALRHMVKEPGFVFEIIDIAFK